MRLLLAAIVGAGATAAGAVVLGDYPMSGSVPWVAAVVIPVIIGAGMNLTAGRHQGALWAVTGPLAAVAMAWGVRIATGYGLDPVPTSCWVAGAIALAWPPALALWRVRRSDTRPSPAPAPAAGRSVDG